MVEQFNLPGITVCFIKRINSFFVSVMTGPIYLNLLQQCVMLSMGKDLEDEFHFQQDGAPLHYHHDDEIL